MTYITQKMDLVMIDFHIEYPGAEKYTSLIPQHLFPHKFVQEGGIGVQQKNERVQSNIISDTEVWFLKKECEGKRSISVLLSRKKSC